MLPEVTARLDADVSAFINAWDRAADAAVRNAARIRAAIASLPEVTRIRVEVDIDNERFRDLNGELDRLTRAARQAGDAMRDLGNNARRSREGVNELGENSRRAGDDVNHLGERARRAGDALNQFGGRSRMAALQGKVMAAAIGLLLSVLPAVAAAALAAGAALQGLMVAGAVVAGGWRGISQAGERLKATLGGLQKQLESVFRSELSREFQQLGQAIAGMDGPLKEIARSVSGVVKEFTGWIRSAEGMRQIETMLGGVDNMLKSLGPGAKAAGQLFTEFGSAAAPAMDEIGKALSSVIENITEVVKKGKETGQLEKAFLAGASAIEAFGEVLAGIIDILIEMAAAGGEPAAEAIKKFGQAMQDAAPLIGTMFGYLAQAANILMTVVGWFAKLAKALEPVHRAINQANAGFTEFLKVISPDKIKEIGKAITDFAKKLGTDIKKGADAAIKAVKDWWNKTKQDVKKGVDDVVKAVKDWWNKTKQDVKKGTADAIKAVKDWWNKTVQDIKAGVAKVVQSVKDWWNKTVQEVKAGAEKVVQAVKDWMSETAQDVKAGAQKVVDDVKQWWDDTVSAVQEGVDKAVAAVKELPDKAIAALAPWAKDMEKAGKDAGEGLDKGLESTASRLAATAKAIAQRALNAIKSTLGIRSPSVVMRDEVGAMMSAGLAEGIIANAGLVTDAMQRAGLAGLVGGGAGAGLARGRGQQMVLTLHVAGGADTAVGVMIARLAQQGKLKITANAVVR